MAGYPHPGRFRYLSLVFNGALPAVKYDVPLQVSASSLTTLNVYSSCTSEQLVVFLLSDAGGSAADAARVCIEALMAAEAADEALRITVGMVRSSGRYREDI